jgi:ADP-ribose pyrophosphatase
MSKAEHQQRKELQSLTKKETAFKGNHLNLVIEKFKFNGKEKAFEIVERRPAVAILPITNNNEIIFVKQYRRAIKAITTEIPAGICEEGEAPSSTAIREMQEEIGFKPNTLIPFGRIHTTAGFCNELIEIFIGKDLEKSFLECDEDEEIDVITASFEKAKEMIFSGEITDSKTICTIFKYLNWINKL